MFQFSILNLTFSFGGAKKKNSPQDSPTMIGS